MWYWGETFGGTILSSHSIYHSGERSSGLSTLDGGSSRIRRGRLFGKGHLICLLAGRLITSTEGQPQTQEASWLYQQWAGLLFNFQFPCTSHELFQCRNFLLGSFSAKVLVKKPSWLPCQPASLWESRGSWGWGGGHYPKVRSPNYYTSFSENVNGSLRAFSPRTSQGHWSYGYGWLMKSKSFWGIWIFSYTLKKVKRGKKGLSSVASFQRWGWRRRNKLVWLLSLLFTVTCLWLSIWAWFSVWYKKTWSSDWFKECVRNKAAPFLEALKKNPSLCIKINPGKYTESEQGKLKICVPN